MIKFYQTSVPEGFKGVAFEWYVPAEPNNKDELWCYRGKDTPRIPTIHVTGVGRSTADNKLWVNHTEGPSALYTDEQWASRCEVVTNPPTPSAKVGRRLSFGEVNRDLFKAFGNSDIKASSQIQTLLQALERTGEQLMIVKKEET